MISKRRSYKGQINITNGIINKSVEPDKLNIFLSKGWRRGQVQKITKLSRKLKGDKFRNTYFVTNGIDNLRIPND